MSEAVPPPGPETPDEVAPETPAGRDGTRFMYAGMALIALSFMLSWWSITKYRISDQRGEDVQSAEFQKWVSELSEEERAEYHEEIASYQRAWQANNALYQDFYKQHLVEGYGTELANQESVNHRSGTLKLRGWSTWTGWFGVTFVVLALAMQFAPKLSPELEPWAWGMPWASAILFGLFTIMALSFYFTVPSPNGDGYSQGVDWGNYLAIIGGGLAAVGCVFEGMRAAERRIAEIEARGDEPIDEPDDEPEPPPSPSKPAKSRLQDW